MNNDLVTLPDAAERLGVPTGTMRRWLRQGLPVAQPGRRGRGHAARVSLPAVRAWRDAQRADEKLSTQLANELPKAMADAVYEGWRSIEGPDKRRLAGLVAVAWLWMAESVLDHLRARYPDAGIGHLSTRPEAIERLAKIAGND